MDSLGVALSGMQSAQTKIAVSAHNVANLLTEDFRPSRAVQSSRSSGGSDVRVEANATRGPVSIEREVVDQIQAGVQYTASARVLEVGADLRGSLLDILA